ncbi:splicing factor 3A subunit 2-like isoform X2 [Periplaneta americana]|uniref:splicing factor 3A subunit 2-like isoform X2 n=1 Tax=Periplaneta americana TaxID=6978 RepID=UPI0037E7226B
MNYLAILLTLLVTCSSEDNFRNSKTHVSNNLNDAEFLSSDMFLTRPRLTRPDPRPYPQIPPSGPELRPPPGPISEDYYIRRARLSPPAPGQYPQIPPIGPGLQPPRGPSDYYGRPPMPPPGPPGETVNRLASGMIDAPLRTCPPGERLYRPGECKKVFHPGNRSEE